MASQSLASCQLDWEISTTELFSLFCASPWAMLLDSANARHPDAHYDIICANPIVTLETQDQHTHVSRLDEGNIVEVTPSKDDPFSILQAVLDEYFPVKKTTHLPFGGGAMGNFSYDLARTIESLPSLALADVSLGEMNIGLYEWALIYDYQQQEWHLIHYQGIQALNKKRQQIEILLQGTPVLETVPFRLQGEWLAQMSFAQYQQKFNQIQNYLHSGDCYQINLTQRFEAGYLGDEWQAYLTLRQANQAPFSAFVRLPLACVLSISPERFIRLDGENIQTKPIKGTLPRHSDPCLDRQSAHKLRHSSKDQAENLMIVDLMRNDIGKVAQPGSVTVPNLFEIESFPAVHHLVSTIEAKLCPQYRSAQLLRAAFPGGSITGAPKIRAMEIIEELELSRRNVYCGAIGYLSQDGKMDTNIAIRTLLAQDGNLYCWAGGGIVADSEVKSEYQESYDKVSSILPVLTNGPV